MPDFDKDGALSGARPVNSSGPMSDRHPELTDTYFKNTRRIVQEHDESIVEYAVFMRRPVTYAGKLAVDWLLAIAAERGEKIEVDQPHIEGAWVGSGEPLCYLRGPLSALVDTETIFYSVLVQPVLPPITAIICVWNCLKLPFLRWMQGIALARKWLN